MKALPTGELHPSAWASRERASGTWFANGDTLLARITPCLENGKLGLVGGLEDGEVACGSTEFIVMRPMGGTPTILPFALCRMPEIRDFAIKHLAGTSGRQRLAANDLARCPIPLPGTESLEGLADHTDPLIVALAANSAEQGVLAQARDELLPLLMSGKLTVKDAEKRAEEVL